MDGVDGEAGWRRERGFIGSARVRKADRLDEGSEGVGGDFSVAAERETRARISECDRVEAGTV